MARYTKSGTVNAVQEINSELEKISTAQIDFLSRTGETPNEMRSNLDMNGNRIINLPTPANLSEPIRLKDLNSLIGTTINLDSEIKVYTSVAELVAQTGLEIGQIVKTKGYYSANDGGGAEYVVVASATGTDDGGSYHNLANGNQAQLLVGSKLRASTFGTVRDGSDQTTAIQKCINFMANAETKFFSAGVYSGGLDGGIVQIDQGVGWRPNLIVFKDNVTIQYDTGTAIGEIYNGKNVSGAVNEAIFESGFHTGLILNSHNDWDIGTLGAGQVKSLRTSIIFQGNGSDNWQLAQDLAATNSEALSLYALNPSRQVLHFGKNGFIRSGRRASLQDLSEPTTEHVFCGNVLMCKDEGLKPALQLATYTAGQSDTTTPVTSKLFELQPDGELTCRDNTSATFPFRFTDDGTVVAKKGVTGSAYTTTQRNALTGWRALDIGSMVFDTTLGKPVFLSATTPTWVDASGAVV